MLIAAVAGVVVSVMFVARGRAPGQMPSAEPARTVVSASASAAAMPREGGKGERPPLP